MMRWLLAIFVGSLPCHAAALSCLPPSVERSYQQASEAPESYVVVRGSLMFDAGSLPRMNAKDQSKTPVMTRIPARLRGVSLSKAGFDLPFDRQVTLEVACFGPWCGSAPARSDVLVFVRKDPGGYAIGINPCGGFLFASPRPTQIRDLLTCHSGGTCEPQFQ